MDTNVLQTLRYKLQKRLKRIRTANWQLYHGILVQTMLFLNESPVVRGILADLERRVPTAHADSEKLMQGELLSGETEDEHVAIAYGLLKRCVAAQGEQEARLGCGFGHDTDYPHGVLTFTDMFVEPVFDYIDEQIDDRRTILGLLVKYKHSVEWFRRDELRALFEDDTQRGEKTLALDLYQYLHGQGLEFSIEPSSISGEPDLISAQQGPDRLIADVKIFDHGKSKGTPYLCRGFNQVYQYTKDYDSSFGYLVVFKTCREDLSVHSMAQELSVPYFTHNSKTIFIAVVDIFDYPEPASKRGSIKTVELLEQDLIRVIEEAASSGPA